MNHSRAMRFAAISGAPLATELELASGRGFIALLEAFRATGGAAPGEIVGRLLDEHQVGQAVSLAKLIDTGQAFGFEWRASLWIPMFQFEAADLSLKLSAQQVRAELPSLWSGWTVASWFATALAQLGGRCPADLLDADLDAVMRAARSVALAGEFTPAPALTRRAHEVAVHV